MEDEETEDEEVDLLAEFEDEYLKFDRVENKLSERPDLHAFLLLNQLCPGKRDMVAGAEHDKIYLDISSDDLKKLASKEQLKELVRCGVMCDSESGGLSMFV
jgi:hypothetical protein